MGAPRYRVSVNGFWCRNESWDDVFELDGKRDEVFVSVVSREIDRSGVEVGQALTSESEVMGDTWRLPNRVRAGSASDRGGIISGDKFPSPTPWRRTGPFNASRVPPYVVWEGELAPGGRMVMLTPTIWEWDPGAGMLDGWLAWQVEVDAKFGQRAKEIFGGLWPVTAPVFDAVSLGIQTVGTLAGAWRPLGQPMRRPIGTRRDPADPDAVVFNAITLALSSETAPLLASEDRQGLGPGILELHYSDDPVMRGVYSVFVQVEQVSGGGVPVQHLQRDWRWCSACQGLFFGGQQAVSRCPAGAAHVAAGASGSGDYSLPMDAAPSPDRQAGWRWCDACQGLYWGPASSSSVCPAGAQHRSAALSGSSEYSLPLAGRGDPQSQSDWRWCSACQSLFFGPGQATSRCPAGGQHARVALSGSADYALPHRRG